MTYCARSIAETVIDYPDLAADDSCLTLAVKALSGVLEKASSLPADVLSNVTYALTEITAAKKAATSVGEDPHQLVTNSFRMTNVVQYASDILASDFTPASTDVESALGSLLSTSLQLSASGISSHSAVALSLIFYNNNPHTNTKNKTLPATLSLSVNIDFEGTAISVFTITNQNIIPVDYTYYPASNHTLRCTRKNVGYYITVNCTSTSYKLYCPPNTRRTNHYYCPSHQNKPSCVTWNGREYATNNNCEVLYTPYSTTCQCKLPFVTSKTSRALSMSPERSFLWRGLAISNSTNSSSSTGGSSGSSSQAAEFAASALLVGQSFANTWQSAGKLNAKTVASNWVCVIYYFKLVHEHNN